MTRTIFKTIFVCNSTLMLFWDILVIYGKDVLLAISFYLPFITLKSANNIYHEFRTLRIKLRSIL